MSLQSEDYNVAPAAGTVRTAPADLALEIAKGIWGSPMGKTHLAKRIVAEIPKHRVYVEPFAGGAQVLFAKEPSQVEVVGDLDPEIAFAFKFVKGLTSSQLGRLRKMSWVGDKALYKELAAARVPDDDVERFYRFAYLTRFGFNKLRRGSMPDKQVGVEARFIDKLQKWAPRLKDIIVRSSDYEKVIDEFDGPDTFFFLDPPYKGYDADVRVGAGHKQWDEARFARALRRIKGQFLCTYGLRGDRELFKGFHTRRWRHAAGVGTRQGQGIRGAVTLVATNYSPPLRKAEGSDEGDGASDVDVIKTFWSSPAGKKRIAKRLAALLPAHTTYVEPFAGSAAVLFAKEPSRLEVLSDVDPEIAQAYRTIRTLKPKDIERLRKMPWTGDEATFKKLFDAHPRGELEKLHRFLYISHFSYGKLRGRSFNPTAKGVEATTIHRLEAHIPRLKNVRVLSGDYAHVVRKYDSAETVFYLDPPYPGYDVDVGEAGFDEARFLKVLKAINGKFLLTYGTRGELPRRFEKEGFFVKRIRPARTIGGMRNVGGPKVLTTLLVSNYKLVDKRLALVLGKAWRLDDQRATSEPDDESVACDADAFAKSIPLIKGADPADERFVLGIVLEPEVVDAQGDIYSADEVRQAAHRFMEEFGGLGLMHRLRVNGQVKVLESYLAPEDFTVGDVAVRKGSWLLAVRILSDALWQQVRDGALTGFSIGGSARRAPEAQAGAPARSEAA